MNPATSIFVVTVTPDAKAVTMRYAKAVVSYAEAVLPDTVRGALRLSVMTVGVLCAEPVRVSVVVRNVAFLCANPVPGVDVETAVPRLVDLALMRR